MNNQQLYSLLRIKTKHGQHFFDQHVVHAKPFLQEHFYQRKGTKQNFQIKYQEQFIGLTFGNDLLTRIKYDIMVFNNQLVSMNDPEQKLMLHHDFFQLISKIFASLGRTGKGIIPQQTFQFAYHDHHYIMKAYQQCQQLLKQYGAIKLNFFDYYGSLTHKTLTPEQQQRYRVINQTFCAQMYQIQNIMQESLFDYLALINEIKNKTLAFNVELIDQQPGE